MNAQVLIAELRDDPLGRGYAGMSEDEAGASLSAADRDITVSHPITRLTLNCFGLIRANAIWARLVAANGQVAYSLENGGLNVNDADVQATLAVLVAADVLTQAEAAALIALANRTVCRAEELGIATFVNWQDVRWARAHMEAN